MFTILYLMNMGFDPNRPYNDLPALPPVAGSFSTPALVTPLVAAHRSLAELKGVCRTLPNPTLLLNAVTLQEGKDSSEIENVVTTQDELYRAAALSKLQGAPLTPGTKEVLRYREAMYEGWERLGATGLLTTNTLIQIMQRIKNTDASIRTQAGTKLQNPATGAVIYTPPEGEALLRDKLHELERFMHEDEAFDPLIRMALIHYQFEAIHPFTDGNGRTGRILNVLYLIQQGLLDYPVLYLSAYILHHKQAYYRGLQGVTERGEWLPWIGYMLEAVQQTAQATLHLIHDIHELREELAARARQGMTTGYSSELMDLIFEHPYCKIGFLVEAGLAKRVTASRYLTALEELGILRSIQVHRDKYYINHRLMELLGGLRL